jgi:hypothetical protein
MEHLPPVADPYCPIFVPYIGDCEYDGLDFAGYPGRKRWDVDRLLKGDFQGFPPTSVAAFLQTWLYFGLMHEILNVKVRTADFIRIGYSGERWLTTEKLPGYLQVFRHLTTPQRSDSQVLSSIPSHMARFRDVEESLFCPESHLTRSWLCNSSSCNYFAGWCHGDMRSSLSRNDVGKRSIVDEHSQFFSAHTHA